MRLKLILSSFIILVAFILPAFSQCNGGGCCNQQNTDNFIKRLGERIEQAKVIIDKSGNAEAKKVLDEAIVAYNKGVDLYNQKKYKEAWVELKNASKLVAKALSMVGGNGMCSNIDVYIKTLGEKIAQAKIVVDKSGNAEAKKVLDEAIVHYDNGVALKNANKITEAWAELKLASSLVCKAMSIATGNNGCNGCGNIDNMIKSVGEKIDQAKVIVDKSGNPEAKKVLDEAVVHYNNALDLKKQGKIQEAMAELKLASQLACKAIQIANSK